MKKKKAKRYGAASVTKTDGFSCAGTVNEFRYMVGVFPFEFESGEQVRVNNIDIC